MWRWTAAWTIALTVVIYGCVNHDQFGLGENEGNTDDDDMADDDMGDDDSSEVPPGDWYFYQLEISLEAIGATEGGDANTMINVTYFGEDEDYICGRQLRFRSTYAWGPDQGDDLYNYADEVITFDEAEETGGDCPADYDIDPDDLMALWEWQIHPLIFVSCDTVLSDEKLAAQPVTLEEFIWEGELGDGTFGFFCEAIGPAFEYFHHTGPAEGVWLRPGSPGDLLEYEKAEFNYFEPADTSNVEVWMFFGFSVASDKNKAEPLQGLEGNYEILPLWDWVIAREEE